VAAAALGQRHVEWFADYGRLEPLLVQGEPGRVTTLSRCAEPLVAA
jgi:hypothetical protein